MRLRNLDDYGVPVIHEGDAFLAERRTETEIARLEQLKREHPLMTTAVGMNPVQQQVSEFMHKMQQYVNDGPPRLPPTDVKALRYQLIDQEAFEVRRSITDNDMVNLARELADLLYVTYGTAVAYGLDLTPYVNEVHRTNMLKDPNNVDEFGKIAKPPGWKPPQMLPILLEAGWKDEHKP